MLTGAEIIRLHKEGIIQISDFDESRVNPNSYNLRLSNEMIVYDVSRDDVFNNYIDTKKDNPTKKFIIPESGIILIPNVLYLGSTIEKTYVGDLIPCISGRSSVARCGIEIHRTAGFGDVGFDGTWTLEITVVYPTKVYPGQEICQIYFEYPDGETSVRYHGKYQNQSGPVASRFYKDK